MKLAIAFAVIAAPAFAQPQPCAKHDDMLKMLKDQFGEVVIDGGMTSTGNMIETTVNPKTHTWTAIITNRLGESCIPAAGDHFKSIPPGDPA